MTESEPTGLRLLVLDGGDIRCLSQLSILEEFLHQVQWRRKSEEILLPCDYFHMICATGPAGMIVIFLVVFRMSIQEAKDEFVRIWLAVFTDDSSKPEERSAKLERMIRNLLRRRNMSSNRKLLHGYGDEACKAFVGAISPAAPTACQKLRTYRSPQRPIDISVVDAIRATCATPDRFTSVKVESPCSGLDAALKPKSNLNSNHDALELVASDDVLQNPTLEAMKELHELYGAQRRVACVLSLGCGRSFTLNINVLRENRSNGSWRTGVLQAERVTEELDVQIGRSQVYHRFSVDRGLESPESIPLSNLGAIETHTKAYLQQNNIGRDMQNCVRASEICGYTSTADLYCPATKTVAATHGLPPLCASFVMRQEVMDSMARCMFDSEEVSQKIMILSGMGGSGKTQLVSKFARTYLSRFHHVIFIDARTTESIKNGIISRVRSLGGVCTTRDEALDFLAQMDPHSSPWFLILDNADDPTLDLGPVIPNCEHGYVAITTRNPTVGDLNPQGHIKLDVMSEDEALQVLLRTIYNSMEQATDDDHINGLVLIKELGFLPVAIVQAGSYIKHQGRGCMKGYLLKLREHRQKLLSIPAKSQRDRHYHAVYATLDVTLDVLSPPAKNLLGILAYFNYTGFPLPLVDRAASRKFLYEPFDLFDRPPEFQETAQFLSEIFSPEELREVDVLAEIEQFSLVVRVKNYSMVTLRFHPLVHAWMSDKIASKDKNKYWDAALRLLGCGTGEVDEDLSQYLFPQLASLSPTRDNAHLNDLAAITRLHLWEGDNKAALTIWEGIYQETIRVHGAAHLRTAAAKLQLALAYSTTMNSPWETWELLRMIEEVVAIRSRLLSLSHPDTLEAISSISDIKMTETLRQISELDILRQGDVVKNLHQSIGHSSQLLALKSQEVLAKMHMKREEWEEAGRLLSEVTQMRVKIQGKNHWMTLRSRQLLAHLYMRQSQSIANTDSQVGISAKTLQKEVVADRMKQQGPHHVDTLKAQQSLAEIYYQTGQYTLADATLRKVIENYNAINGNHDVQLLACMESWVKVLAVSEQYDEARAQLQQIVKKYKEIGDNWNARGAMQSLAKLIKELGDSSDTVASCEQLIVDYKEMGDNTMAIQVMESLAKQQEKWGKLNDAMFRWEQSIAEWKAQGDNRQALEAMESLAKLLEKVGRFDDAVARWDQCIAEWKADGDSWRADQAMQSLTELLEKVGRLDDAVARRDQWIAEWKVEGNNKQAVQAMKSLVELLEKMGRPDDAVARWDQWIAEWKADGDNWRAGQAMESLAKLLEKMGRLDDAVARRDQWIAEWKVEGNNKQAVQAMKSLVELLEKMGRPDDAVARWEQWIVEWKAEGDNERAGRAMELLAELLEKVGRLDDAAVARCQQAIAKAKAEGDCWQVGEAMESLAELLENMGRLDDAVTQWEQAIAELKVEGGGQLAGEAMAKLLEKMGRLDDAVARWDQVIGGWQANGNYEEAGEAMESLAELLEKKGRLDDAVVRWEQWIAQWKAKGDNEQTIQAMESLAKLLEKMGRLDDAMARWEQAIAEWKVEGDNWQATEAMESLAKLLEKMGRLDDAVARWEQVIEEWKTEDNDLQSLQSLRIRKAGRAMKSLAELLEKVGRLDDAVARRDQWIAEWKVEGNNKQAVQAMKSLVELLEKMGRPDDAVARWEQWIVEWKAEGDNERAGRAMELLAELLEKMGRLDDAMVWRKKIEDESVQYPF